MTTHKSPSSILGSTWFAWAWWTIPQLIFLFLNYRDYSLISDELDETSRVYWIVIFSLGGGIIGLGLLIPLLSRFGKAQIPILIAFILIPAGLIIYGTVAVESAVPTTVDFWILNPGNLVFNLWACQVLVSLYGFVAICARASNAGGFPVMVTGVLSTIVPACLLWLFIQFASDLVSGGNYVFTILVAAISSATLIIGFGIFLTAISLLKTVLKHQKSASGIGITVLIALILPLAGLALNASIPFPQTYQNTVIYILTIANAIALMIPPSDNLRLRRFHLLATTALLPFSLYFFCAFLPFYPLAGLAMIAIGAGFLILTPLLLTVLHVGKIGLLVRSLPGSRTNALTVILGVLIMPGILLFGMVRDRIAIEEAMNYAISPNPEELRNPPDRDRVERVLQAVHLQSRGIQYPIISPIYRSVVLRGMTIPDSTYSRLQESFGVEEPEEFEPEMGFWSVRERGPNQSRRVSRMEALAELNSIGFQESGNGTLSIEFEVSNPTSGFRTEYRTTFTIPTGTWVSGAELLINGEWKPADFRERRSAEWIYRMIASERIRDPLLVTLQSPNELQVEVFPVDTDKPRRFRVHLQSITGRVSGISIENYSWTPTTKSPSFLTVGHNLLVSPTVELPYQKLSPEYHLFLDRSSFGSRYKSFERELQRTLSEIPQGAHLQWWLIHDGITALPELPAIHDPSIIQSLSQYNIPKERSGGVTIDLLQLAVLHHWRTDLRNGEVPDTYPVIVPIGLKEEDSVSPSTLRFIDPMIGAVPGWILSKDSDLPASDQEAYIFRRDGRIGVVPRDLKDNSSRWAFLFPTSGPIEYLNQARDFALLGEENIATVDNPPAGFLIQMKDALSRYNPAQHEADRAEMISESKSASVLIPDTALIVLETSAQEKFLLELEKLGTEGHSGLSFSETPEPSLIIIGGFGIWLLCQRGRRNQTKDPRK